VQKEFLESFANTLKITYGSLRTVSELVCGYVCVCWEYVCVGVWVCGCVCVVRGWVCMCVCVRGWVGGCPCVSICYCTYSNKTCKLNNLQRLDVR